MKSRVNTNILLWVLLESDLSVTLVHVHKCICCSVNHNRFFIQSPSFRLTWCHSVSCNTICPVGSAYFRTLNGYMDKIPAKRVEECRSILREFYKTDDITREHIESASSLDER